MKDSQLIYFAYADFEEERMKFEAVKNIYEKILANEFIDPTLVSYTFVSYSFRHTSK